MKVWDAVKVELLRKHHELLLGHGHPLKIELVFMEISLKLIELVEKATNLSGAPRHLQLPHSTSEFQSHRMGRRRHGG